MKRLEYFSQNNEIYFFCVVDNDDEYEYRADLLKYCKEVHLYKRNKGAALFKLIKGPFVCVSRWIASMKKDINVCFERENIDWVIVEFPQMLGNISRRILNSNKLILSQHNIEYATLNNLAKSITNPLKRLIYNVESKRLYYYEERCYREMSVKLFTFVSIEDKAFFERKFGKSNTLLVPIGTEIHEYKESKDSCNAISFFGKMSYPPNKEAAIWFSKNVFPLVQKEIPASKFYIVGKDPSKELMEISEKNPNIIVTGTLDSIEGYYERTDLVVIPLSHGGGVKVKVLEALGYGKLVVSTSKGIEGTTFQNGEELLTSSSAEEFAAICIDVLQNLPCYEKVRRGGYESVRKNFTWKAVVEKFELELNRLK
ncbi:glycosyltransferase family 4 protein [uncultured Bacteroides sp.]|nr:glycosyltransferase family 4 protein [uncultured Bacteroides sp.]